MCSDDDNTKALKQRIEDDPDPLVRYCLLEGEHERSTVESPLYDPDRFFELPHDARLALVRNLGVGGGWPIANLISNAVFHRLKTGEVSEFELFEILSDYVTGNEFKGAHSIFHVIKGQDDIESLWQLVLIVPESSARILIENLPVCETDIPEEVIDGMTDQQLVMLFYRSDVGLEETRKKIFFERIDTRGDVRYGDVCDAVASCNFNISYEEFSALLLDAQLVVTKARREALDDEIDKEGLRAMRALAGMAFHAQDLSLVFYEVINDFFHVAPKGSLRGLLEGPRYYGDSAIATLQRRLESWPSSSGGEEIRELRLYRLAEATVPWKIGRKEFFSGDVEIQTRPINGDLKFLEEQIVEGNTWATFIAFSDYWSKESWLLNKSENHLPRIYEIDKAGEPAES